MNTNYLLPYRFKKMGWILLILGIILGTTYFAIGTEPAFLNLPVFAIIHQPLLGDSGFFQIITDNIFDELIVLLLIIGAIFAALSKEKQEDEFIAKIRLESLLWATYINYGILVLALIFVYEFSFLLVLVFNMFTILLFFVLRFNWVLYQSKKIA